MLIVLLIALANPTPEFVPSGKGNRLSAAERGLFMAKVNERLPSADGALYRWPAIMNKAVYCGWVNARDQEGELGGYRPFFATWGRSDEGAYVARVMVSKKVGDVLDRLLRQDCERYGYDLSLPAEHAPE